MSDIKLMWAVFGVLFILVGLTGFLTHINKKWTKTINTFKGVKTQINSETITMWKIVGGMFILLGLVMLQTALTN